MAEYYRKAVILLWNPLTLFKMTSSKRSWSISQKRYLTPLDKPLLVTTDGLDHEAWQKHSELTALFAEENKGIYFYRKLNIILQITPRVEKKSHHILLQTTFLSKQTHSNVVVEISGLGKRLALTLINQNISFPLYINMQFSQNYFIGWLYLERILEHSM